MTSSLPWMVISKLILIGGPQVLQDHGVFVTLLPVMYPTLMAVPRSLYPTFRAD